VVSMSVPELASPPHERGGGVWGGGGGGGGVGGGGGGRGKECQSAFAKGSFQRHVPHEHPEKFFLIITFVCGNTL
jgi:hypothetical protein